MARFVNKQDLASEMGVSQRTVARYLNRYYFTRLSLVGYRKTQRLLTPHQYRELCLIMDHGMEDETETSKS